MTDLNKLLMRLWRAFTRPPTPPAAYNSPAPVYRLPATHKDAAARLVDHAVVKSFAFRNRLLKEPTDGVHHDLLRFSLALQKELHKRGYPFFVHDYLRPREEQEAAYRNGTSKARFGQSAHNFGMAADIVHFGRYWNLSRKEWDVIGLIGKEVARRLGLAVTWGGDWRFYDPAHWELTDWKALRGDMIAFYHGQKVATKLAKANA